MIIFGVKGLAKELLAVLSWNNDTNDLYFFDNVNADVPDYLYETFATRRKAAPQVHLLY